MRAHRFLGREVRIGHHAAWRHYWTIRNGVILIKEHIGHNPKWALTNALFLARWFAQVVVFEPKRGTHVPACLKGLRDGSPAGWRRRTSRPAPSTTEQGRAVGRARRQR